MRMNAIINWEELFVMKDWTSFWSKENYNRLDFERKSNYNYVRKGGLDIGGKDIHKAKRLGTYF